MIHTKPGKTTGFTLTELLVVIGIMVMMVAMIFPATQSLRQGNRVARCSFRLQQIGNAIKMYHVDYKGVPPVYILETSANPDDGPDAEIADVNTEPYNNGLHILFDSGYLTNRRALHCPTDTDHPDPNTPEYYQSFVGPDEAAEFERLANGYPFDYEINRYKYMPCRTWNQGDPTDPNEPDGRRQLAPRVKYEWIWDDVSQEHRWAWVPVAGRLNATTWGEEPVTGVYWYPDDTTIITWCNLHVDEFVRQDEGMYQVLFWDGSVKALPASLFDGSRDLADPTYRDAAWKVTPHILEQE